MIVNTPQLPQRLHGSITCAFSCNTVVIVKAVMYKAYCTCYFDIIPQLHTVEPDSNSLTATKIATENDWCHWICYRNYTHFTLCRSCLPIYRIAIARSLSFDDFEGNANISVAIKSDSTVAAYQLLSKHQPAYQSVRDSASESIGQCELLRASLLVSMSYWEPAYWSVWVTESQPIGQYELLRASLLVSLRQGVGVVCS